MSRCPPGDPRRAPARPGPARWAVGLLAALSGAASGALPAVPQPVWAGWAVAAGASGGQATAGSAPAAPTGVSSACGTTLLGSLSVSWTAVPGATSYTVFESTTSATSGFSLAAAGLTGTTWSSTFLAGSYWFYVVALIGSNWQSGPSTVTGPRQIALLSLLCS